MNTDALTLHTEMILTEEKAAKMGKAQRSIKEGAFIDTEIESFGKEDRDEAKPHPARGNTDTNRHPACFQAPKCSVL